MNLATQIKNSAQDPRKWIGRRSRDCRKHGDSIHYVNHLGQIGCIECDQPADSRVSLRLRAHEGAWFDSDCGFDVETPQWSTQKLEIGSTIVHGNSTSQIMPVDPDGNPITWYDYDKQHGKPPNMPYEAYVVLRWIMYEFNESGRELNDLEFRFGKRR